MYVGTCIILHLFPQVLYLFVTFSDCSVMLYRRVSALMRNGKGEGKAAIGSGQSGIVEESAKSESHFHYCMPHVA